jgi:CDP-diglyceride synthetase
MAYYVLFCFLEFGLIALLLAKKFRKEPLFIIAVVSLIIIPWCSAGRSNDFAMRVSIPALLVLTIYTARWFVENGKNKNSVVKTMLICCVIIGAVTPANEFIRSIKYTIYKPSQCIADDWKTFSTISKFKIRLLDNFIGIDPGKTFFFNTLSKAKNEKFI